MRFNLRELLKKFKADIKNSSDKNNVSDADFEIIWKQVIDKIDNEPPPKVAVIGNTGVGKSSTLNALFNAGQEISHTEACTQFEGEINIIANTVEGEKGFLTVYDMPGLDESISSQENHIRTYEKVLKDVDVVIWVMEAHNRGIKNIQDTLNIEIRRISPNLLNKIVFALNKVDLIHPGPTDWNPLMNLPSDEQLENIKKRAIDVKSKIKEILPEWNSEIIGYSSEKRYNLTNLFSIILDAVPKERRWVVESRRSLSDFLELVDERVLSPEFAAKKRANKIAKITKEKEKMQQAFNNLSDSELAEFLEKNKSRIDNLIN